MIKVGTDIIELSRISEMKRLDLFIKRVFTKREQEYLLSRGNKTESIAGAFAAKEAFSKYAGSGFRGFGFLDIEVLHNEMGSPYLCFMGKRLNADVSISHCKKTVVATVCGEQMALCGEEMEYMKSYRAYLPKRQKNMHKGDCGRVLAVAGSSTMVGAACLCARSAMRCGSGLVTLATAESVQPLAAIKLDEVMTMPLLSRGGQISKEAIVQITDKLADCDACAIGPGLGRGEDIKTVVKEVLMQSVPCVVDADALNVIAEDTLILKNKKCKAVITPHTGEMSRLTGLSAEEIEADRVGVALSFAKEYDVVVILKGSESVVASPSGEVHINNSGNNGMASGGMGDVLTGAVASFIGQGTEIYNSAILGTFIHGLAGDMARDKMGEFGLIAGDVVDMLPLAIKSLLDFGI